MARKNRVTPGTPDAVRKAAKKADDLHKEIYGDPENDTNDGKEAEAPGNDETGEGGDIQPVEPQAQVDSSGDTSELTAMEGGKTPATVQEVAPPPTQEPSENWEQKYKALQGKYNAEVPRLAGELREVRQQMQQLMEAQTKPVEAPTESAPDKNVVTEQDLVDYGEDLVDFIRRIAKAEATNAAANLTPKIHEIQGQIQQSSQRQAKNSVYSKLDHDVQDWREINKSPEFLDWLATLDPYAGDYRKNLLAQAFENGDADRVVAFFKGYKAERQAVTPTSTSTPAPAAEPASQQPQVSLEQLAGPAGGATNGVVNTQPQQTPNWTRGQIASFYNDVNAGVYAKDPDRKAQIEASIAAALREGRIS